MTPPDFQPNRVARDPVWLPHRYEPSMDTVHFAHVPREAHRRATFLIDEQLPLAGEPIVLRRQEVLAARPTQAPINYIFHSAFCCSTLLARAFDVDGAAMGLKEPMILNDVVGWRLRGGDPKKVAAALDCALVLLARPFAPGETVVVKPSNIVNGLANAMLALRPNARALLLFAPLETYLGSIARKGMWGRLWVRDLLMKLLRQGLIDLGFTPEDHLQQTDLQVAAVGWLAQHALFAKLVATFGPERVRTIDSEALVAHPLEAMNALDALYATGLGSERVGAIVEGPVFRRHSKLGSSFGSVERAVDLHDAVAVHGEEIEKVAAWAKIVAANAGLSLTLGAPLLTS
jgi:hypothetical protein